ncbi:hypothetical protein [Helicobacter brantae]|uniref:Uncharacterized protein n=1 Tax=Helicobacter brantae TaxID=375927 RepID=A0A3D8J156_9HELI|nr:hypothetical protein [Helicobacter brantae]RDU71208.1 hypothetical protein CQA58_03590 [Helicobacter brantae]
MRKITTIVLLLISSILAQDLSYQEIQNIAKESADDFLKEYTERDKATLIVSSFKNDTNIDDEIFTRALLREIRKSGRYNLVNSVGGDSMVYDARGLRNNEEFNPETTTEKGELVAPDISLSGKISKSTNGDEETYLFLLTLTDIKTGLVIWDRDVILSKNLTTSSTKVTTNTPAQTQVQKKAEEKVEKKTQELSQVKRKELPPLPKNSYFLFGFDGEVGADGESNVLYSGDLRVGYTYRWNHSYAISVFGMYRFWNDFYPQKTTTTSSSKNSKSRGKPSNSSDDEDNEDNQEEKENKFVHGVGGGVQIKMGYFYLGGGLIIDLEDTYFNFLGEAGLAFPLGSSANLNIGARYTHSQSDGVKNRFGGVIGFSFFI